MDLSIYPQSGVFSGIHAQERGERKQPGAYSGGRVGERGVFRVCIQRFGQERGGGEVVRVLFRGTIQTGKKRGEPREGRIQGVGQRNKGVIRVSGRGRLVPGADGLFKGQDCRRGCQQPGPYSRVWGGGWILAKLVGRLSVSQSVRCSVDRVISQLFGQCVNQLVGRLSVRPLVGQSFWSINQSIIRAGCGSICRSVVSRLFSKGSNFKFNQ